MKQRPVRSFIDRIYRTTNNDLALAGGASGTLSFQKSDFGFTSDDAIKPMEFLVTLGVSTGVSNANAPVQARFSWLIEGTTNSRVMMISPGTQKTYRIRVPASTDYSAVAANVSVLGVHCLNLSTSNATNVIAQVEAWFNRMPSYP